MRLIGWVARRKLIGLTGRAARTPRGITGLSISALVVALAIVGPWLAPHSTTAFVGAPFSRSAADAWLGTDQLGRDVLSRVLAGGRTILVLSALATIVGVAVGTLLGLVAGYVKGVVDEGIMRVLDVVLAFPQVILALLLVSLVGPRLWLICAAVAATHAPQVARVARAATVQVGEQEFVVYADGLGIPRLRVITGELLPNIVGPVMVELGLRFTYSIGLIASLSFLGFGLQPPGADWGLMINENQIGIEDNMWSVLAPIVVIALITVGTNMFTDAIARVVLGVDAVQLEAEADEPGEETVVAARG